MTAGEHLFLSAPGGLKPQDKCIRCGLLWSKMTKEERANCTGDKSQ